MTRKRQVSDEYDRELPKLAASGLTLSEIGDELGRSPGAIRNAARRRLIPVTREHDIDEYRRAIRDMEPEDREQYLLDCIETLLGITPEKTAAERWGFHVTKQQARLLAALEARSPAVVPRGALYDAMFFDQMHNDPPEMKILDIQIHNLRKRLPPEFGKIRTAWGLGYRLEKAK